MRKSYSKKFLSVNNSKKNRKKRPIYRKFKKIENLYLRIFVLFIFICIPITVIADVENKITFSILDYDKLTPIKGAKISIEDNVYLTNENGIIEINNTVKEDKKTKKLIKIKISHPDYYTDFPELINLNENEVNFLLIPNNLVLKAKGKILLPPEKRKELIVGIFIAKKDAIESDPDWKKWEFASNPDYIRNRFKPKTIKEKKYRVYSFLELFDKEGSYGKVDKDGNFSISFIPIRNEENFKIIASSPNFGFSELIIPKDKLEDITLSLSKKGGITVAGKIVDANDKPIIGAELTCEYTKFSIKTDDNGRFSISNCWPSLFYFDINPGKDLEAESIFLDTTYYRPQEHTGTWDNLKVVCYPRKTKNILDAYQEEELCKNFYSLAFENLNSGKYHEAIDNFSKAILLLNYSETVSNSLINRALAYLAIGDMKNAYNDCYEALMLSPMSAYVSFIAGWLELLAGKSELAEKHFSNAINFRDNKDKNTPYYALGLYLSSLANGKNEKTYLKNIKISEDDKIGILFNLIINSSNESDIEKVLNIVNEQQKMDIYFYLGEIYKFTGKKKKAEEYFKNAIQLKKFNTIEYIITMVELEILKGNITNFNFPKANINHTLLFDFEKEQISDIFNPPQGGLLSSISPLSEHLSKTINDPPLGKALKISSPQKGFLYTKKGILLENLKNYEYLTFWTYNSSNNKPIFELQFIEEGGIAKFWRRIEITKTGWTKITIPLRFMRQSENRTPSWRNIKYLGLFFRDAADIYIDNFTFLKSSEKNAILSEEELAEIAFPLTQKLQIQKLITNDYIILTNSQEIELKTLENKINEFFSTIKKDFEGVKKSEPDSPPTLIIFANQEEYRNFIPRFAALLLAQADTPKSGGYTIHSIATSFWKSDMGTLRPVYFHEIFHTWLDKFYAFPSGNGDWLQEGFANYYQITFFPQENLSKIIQTALLEGFTPLEELCNGSRISMNQYWQALTVVAMLMNKKEYRNKLTNLLNTFIEKNSVNLTAVITEIYGIDMQKFTSDWKKFCMEYSKQLKNKK